MDLSRILPVLPAAALHLPSTPNATTATILRASSFPGLELCNDSNQESEHPSSQSPRKQMQKFALLRSHSLVSNSIFFQQATSSQLMP
ncbi:hypothetical protein ACQY0O_005538 [Thecaphora frezii]